MTNKTDKSKYYAVRNKALANGLHFLTGQRFYIMDLEENPDIKVYTFERTDKLMDAMGKMTTLKKELNQ